MDQKLFLMHRGTQAWYAHGDRDEARHPSDYLPIFLGEHENTPFRIKIDRGRTSDFLWYDVYPLINDDLVRLLQQYAVTGWRTHRVSVKDRIGSTLKNVNGFSVIGRTGNILFMDIFSQEKTRVDMSKWDGSDIFVAGRSSFVFATSRVVEIMTKAKVTGIRWTAIVSEK